MTTPDNRAAAVEQIDAIIHAAQALPAGDDKNALIAECQSLTVAIRAFHMEGIRFRMFNVDRLLTRGHLPLPPETAAAFAEARHHLEAAGFHTRSHQAP